MAKNKGNIGDIMIMGIFVLAMMSVMFAFMNYMELIQKKAEISQLARKYILVAETNGYLSEGNCEELLGELEAIGVTEVDISDSTLTKAEFGKTVSVCIKGKLKDTYEITERKSSTAKY